MTQTTTTPPPTRLRSLVALPYELARRPLAALDSRLADRLPEQVGTRLAWALGSADKVAGTLLRHPGITQRGVEQVDRATRLMTASRLEEEAETRREAAREVEAEGLQEAARRREAAQERAAAGLDEADEVKAQGQRKAEQRAAEDAATKKDVAAKRAAGRKAAAQRRKEQAAEVAEAEQRDARRKAKAELDEASQDQQAAEESRADAERLSELADAAKQQRKAD